MKHLPFFCLLLSVSTTTWGEGTHVLVSLGDDAYNVVRKQFAAPIALRENAGKVKLIQVAEKDLPEMAQIIHNNLHRCGGFMIEKDVTGFQTAMRGFTAEPAAVPEYKIGHPESVRSAMEDVKEPRILERIQKLSGFQNRYYHSPHGVQSMKWIFDEWTRMIAGKPNASVAMFNHTGYNQPSVILTLKGSKNPDEIVILGGHGDSISGWSPSDDVRAPGADDDASGVATVMEVASILLDRNLWPERTVQFIAYAAEEVGLRGSADIAAEYKAQHKKVIGVIQLDMTNYPGSNLDMVLITDFTNAEQNTYLTRLLATYLPQVKWENDRCGYACSDHASWTRNGFVSSIPFESRVEEYNPHIHTADDTIDQSNRQAAHSINFAKLALAYAIERSSL